MSLGLVGPTTSFWAPSAGALPRAPYPANRASRPARARGGSPAPSPAGRSLPLQKNCCRWRESNSLRRAAPCRRAIDRAASRRVLLNAQRAMSTPLIALNSHRSVAPNTSSHKLDCQMSSIFIDVCARSETLEIILKSRRTASARCVNVAQPQPTRPASVVSIFTTTSRYDRRREDRFDVPISPAPVPLSA